MNKLIRSGLKILGGVTAIAATTGCAAFVKERIEEAKAPKDTNKHKPYGVYEKYIKRPLDCSLSTGALIVLSPVLGATALLVKTKLLGEKHIKGFAVAGAVYARSSR